MTTLSILANPDGTSVTTNRPRLAPGVVLAQLIAHAVNRRRFLGHVIKGTGAIATTVMAGGGLQTLFAAPASAQIYSCDGAKYGIGYGCPGSGYGSPCGPDPCCVGLSSACDCSDNPPNAYCYPSGVKSDCHGYANDYSGGQLNSCWTCYGPVFSCNGCACRYITTCCDCSVSTGCSGDGICISYNIYGQRTCAPSNTTTLYQIPSPAADLPAEFWLQPDWRVPTANM